MHSAIHDAIVDVAQQHDGGHDLVGEFDAVLPVLDVLRVRDDARRLLPLLRNGTTLLDYMKVAGNAHHHAEQVLNAWRRRHIKMLGGRLQQLATGGDWDESGLDQVVEVAMSSFLETLEVVPEAQWEPPTPLSGHGALPAFPTDVLPGWVADQVAAVATFTQTPPDLAGCIALAALSTAVGGRATVQVRPGWCEPVNIYTVVAMPPGSRKSPVFAAMTAALLDAERQLAEQAKPVIVEAQLEQRTAQRDAERYANSAANAPNPEVRQEALGMAADAALAAERLTVPAHPRLIADDVTPETAASLLAEQGGRLAVLSAEGGIFTTLAGRYSGTPNLEVFLKGHAGDLLRVDRKTREAEHVDHPALTLGLAVQPEVLRDIALMPGFRGRGLLARILYSLPRNTVGQRQVGAPGVPPDVARAYEQHLRSLTLSLANLAEPSLLQLTNDANQRMLELEAQLEPRLAEGAELGHITDWASKLNGAIARLAGLLHLAAHYRSGWDRPITTDTINAAAQLGDYYLAHALRVFDYMGTDQAVDHARAVLAWIKRTKSRRFTRRDLMAGTSRSKFSKATDLDGPLDVLVRHGYIRPAPAPQRTGRGRRPSPAYDAHPDLITDQDDITDQDER